MGLYNTRFGVEPLSFLDLSEVHINPRTGQKPMEGMQPTNSDYLAHLRQCKLQAEGKFISLPLQPNENHSLSEHAERGWTSLGCCSRCPCSGGGAGENRIIIALNAQNMKKIKQKLAIRVLTLCGNLAPESRFNNFCPGKLRASIFDLACEIPLSTHRGTP